jgi:hypothetical protein
MVIVRLNGGLGNQLFQYAAGRRLSIFHRTPIKIDLGIYDYHKLRCYSLTSFRIKESIATKSEVAKAQEKYLKNSLGGIPGLIWKFKWRRRWSLVKEFYLGPYNPEILHTTRNVYLDGYWQSEKYFIDVQDVIRQEFTVRNELSFECKAIAALITSTNSVSLHVRRADYVSDSETHQTHGVCNLEYYKKCIDLVKTRVSNPYFFVFSDDISWCKENLHFDVPTTFVTHGGAKGDYEDFRLMSLCKHNVIANSSFSWWAAWLNTNPDKMILAPRKWLNDSKYNTQDVIPDRWIKI